MSDYPKLDKMTLMLQFFSQELERASEEGSSGLLIMLSEAQLPDTGEPGVVIEVPPPRKIVSEALSIRGGEAVALFYQLESEGYLNSGSIKGTAANKFVKLLSISDKGDQLLGALPDPRQDLLEMLEALEEAILTLQDPNVSEQEKQEAARAAGVLRQLAIGVSSSGIWDLARGFLSQG